MKKNASKEDIYNYFFSKEPDVLKAMGMCYFAYSWGLLFLGCEIAQFRFRKTDLGPIDSTVLNFSGKSYNIDATLIDFLYFIWMKYSNYSGKELMERALRQAPCKNATDRISKRSILKFYKKIAKASK